MDSHKPVGSAPPKLKVFWETKQVGDLCDMEDSEGAEGMTLVSQINGSRVDE